MKNDYRKDRTKPVDQYWNRSRIASLVAYLVMFIAIAVFVIWIEYRFLSREPLERPIESACPTSASCPV